MKRFFKILMLIGCISLVFSGCYSNISSAGTASSFSTESDKRVNHQIYTKNVLERKIPSNVDSFFNYSFTNGNDCIDKIYIFKSDPNEFINDDSYLEKFENNYIRKYEYLYLNGNKDSNIQVKKYSRDVVDDSPWYCDQYYYIKNLENKDKISAYHSYEIGTNGTVYDNEYFYFAYDDNGKLTYTSDDVGYENYFSYDEYGVLSGRTFDYKEEHYSYEREGENIVKVYVHDAQNGDTIDRYDYEYDFDNRIVSEKNYTYKNNEESRLYESSSYSYNENGNISIISTEAYDSDTESYKVTRKSYYYDDNNNISQIITEKNEKAEYMLFVYSENPNEYVETYG